MSSSREGPALSRIGVYRAVELMVAPLESYGAKNHFAHPLVVSLLPGDSNMTRRTRCPRPCASRRPAESTKNQLQWVEAWTT